MSEFLELQNLLLFFMAYFRIKKEIEELHREKKDEYKEVLNNEQKFLALELPARHNEGTNITNKTFKI